MPFERPIWRPTLMCYRSKREQWYVPNCVRSHWGGDPGLLELVFWSFLGDIESIGDHRWAFMSDRQKVYTLTPSSVRFWKFKFVLGNDKILMLHIFSLFKILKRQLHKTHEIWILQYPRALKGRDICFLFCMSSFIFPGSAYSVLWLWSCNLTFKGVFMVDCNG